MTLDKKNFDFDYGALDLPTPCFLFDKALLRQNLRLLKSIQERTGCKILLAMKSFSSWCVFPDMKGYIAGVTTSSQDEARLGREELDLEVHNYVPAYSNGEFEEVLPSADHIVFNSFSQYHKHYPKVKASGRDIQCGLRVNPGYSEVTVDIYNPCTANSRLGIHRETFDEYKDFDFDGITGLHFHTMCQQGADVLKRTLEVFEEKFSKYFDKLKWVNFGGGHYITRPEYDVELLCEIISDFRKRTGLDVYLEPGEAVVLNMGFLISSVLDIIQNPNGSQVVIADTSASAHMPDVMEMPYRPEIIDSGQPGQFEHEYLVGGKTCLSGDVIGTYTFQKPLSVGDKLVFCDQAQYSIVKTTTFNGVRLPAIATCDSEAPTGNPTVVRQFGYEDFKTRLS